MKQIKVRVLAGEELENAPISPKYTPQSGGASFAFNVKITITGERLNDAELRQQIKSVTRQWNYDGTLKTREEVIEAFGGDSLVHTGGEYVTDTDWGWASLSGRVTTGTNNGVAVAYDLQTAQLLTSTVPYGEQTTKVARLTEIERDFKLQTRKTGETAILKAHDWGFGWKNTNLRWPADHDPPPPADKPACALLLPGRKGMFYGIYGIENASVLEDVNPEEE